MGDTSQAAYSGGGMRKPPVMPGEDPNQPDPMNPGRRTNPVMDAKSLVTIAPPPQAAPAAPAPAPTTASPTIVPGAPPPATGMPGAPPNSAPAPPAGTGTGYGTMTDKDGNPVGRAGGIPGTGYGPRASLAPPGSPYSHVDAQGNPTGVATINGMQRVRSGSWWLDKKLVDQYGENDDRAQVGRIEYSAGLNQMAQSRQAAATAAKTTATGFDSESERALRQSWANEIGVNEKSDENQDDPVFVAKQVLVDLIKGGHVDKMPNGIFFSYHGDTAARPWEFKNANGADVAPSAELIQMAQQAQQEKNQRYQTGSSGAGGSGAPGAVDINGLPLAPGAGAYGLPGAQVGWQTQARPVSNYPYLAKGALAMPGSPKGVPVIMAEAGVPEVAIPVPKLRAAVGDDAAQRVIDAVSKKTIYPGDAPPKLAAGAEINQGGAANTPNSVPAKPPTYTQIVPPGAGNTVGPNGLPNTGSGGAYTPFTWDGTMPGGGGEAYTPFGGWTPGKYAPYQQQQMTDQEKAQLASISGIAKTMTGQGQNLYSIGAPAYAQAIKYYQTLLGGNRTAMQAATAGSAEAIRAQGRGLEGRITAQLGRSGAADLAKADSANQEAAAIAHLTQGVQPAAAAALQGAGLEGANAGASMESASADMYSKIQSALTQSRQYEEGLSENSRQFGASFEEQSRQFGTQLTETSRQFAASLAEQVRQGNLSYNQAIKALELNDHQFQTSFGLQQKSFDEQVRQFNESLKIQQSQVGAQKSGNKGAAIASGIGTAAMIVIAI